LAQARSELETTIQDLSSDLQDLVDSVKAVESDPFSYGLDIDEVGRRRKLVKDVGDEVEDMRDELRKVAGAQKNAANGSALPPPSAFDPDAPDGDEYEAFEQQRQVEIMHEQDEALDGVFKTVGNLRQQANDMGRELEEQHEMLEEVDTLAERVGGKLQGGIKKVGYVIKKNEELWTGIRPTLTKATLKYLSHQTPFNYGNRIERTYLMPVAAISRFSPQRSHAPTSLERNIYDRDPTFRDPIAHRKNTTWKDNTALRLIKVRDRCHNCWGIFTTVDATPA
ncbi:MAG: hypothetical protein Q9183_004232, partial [Haloplaca sp. 2 TL-2023]